MHAHAWQAAIDDVAMLVHHGEVVAIGACVDTGVAVHVQRPFCHRGRTAAHARDGSVCPMAKRDPTHLREIDRMIAAIGDWRGPCLARVRRLIHEAVPDVVEEVKWRKPTNPAGVPVWSCGGIICTGETYSGKVKLTFPSGAAIDDPAGLFNASLAGNARRAIDIREGDVIDEKAFVALVRAAASRS